MITHYGEFKEYKIRNFRKLIGKDIIVAHQLLKNDIADHEYWLMTNGLSDKKPIQTFKPWMLWEIGSKKIDQQEITFHFTQLSQLKKMNYLENR